MELSTANNLPQLSFEREDVRDVVPMVRRLAADGPLHRVRTPFGDEAWLVTGHSEVRALLTDARVGRSHPDPERAARVFDSPLGGPIGEHDNAAQQQAHLTMRRYLAGAFSPGRMQRIQPQIEARVDELLDAVTALPQPVDLHEHLSWPLPVLVMCDLLGVPPVERDEFRSMSEAALNMTDWATAANAWMALTGYMRGLVERKQAEPGADLLTDLIAQQRDGELSNDDIVNMAAGLLAGGFETTVARIDLGIVFLLTEPGLMERLRSEPSQLAGAVDEVLRLAVPGGGALPRYAQEDIEIGGVQVRKGDAVIMDMNVANRDPRVFADPDRFDPTRSPNPHLSFGHGPSACIGSSLGRLELRVVFSRLLERLPGLALAVPVDQLALRTNQLTGGLVELPVRW